MLKRNRNIIYEYEVCPGSNPGTIQNDVVSLKFVCILYALKLRRFSLGTLAVVVLKGSTFGYDLKCKVAKLIALMGTPNSSDISPVISWLILGTLSRTKKIYVRILYIQNNFFLSELFICKFGINDARAQKIFAFICKR